MEFDSVIVRFGGEIGIKGRWTRRAYEKMLSKNIKKVLRHYSIQYKEFIHKHGRIYVRTENVRDTAHKTTRVFGVSSVSPAVETTSDMNEIAKKAVELADKTLRSGNSFAVRCRRVGKHSYSSMEICKEIGEQILKNLKNRDLVVDLSDPQFTINIEVRDEDAYIFSESISGAGGFPLGSQPKVVCLLSGGIDSAVACWLVMKRGCPIIPVYFDITPFTDKTATTKALDVATKLFKWTIGFPRKVYVVPHGKNLDTLVRKGPSRLTCILCKRMMYRIAERIADTEKAEGIITGEAIGEQASQTLHNLRVLDEAVSKYPIHRPVLGFNKLETEELAKKISSFGVSTRKTGGCTAAPKNPATKANLENVKKAEEALDIEEMITESIREAEIVKV